MILILHNIRSVHNVGSIFRTSDAAGVSRVILSGYTPTPIDRFGRERGDFAKVSLGAEKTVPWTYVKTLAATLTKLKKEHFTIAAVEQDKTSISLFDWKPLDASKLALIMGNEVLGMSKPLLQKCEVILEIPMHGKKESLNVSVTVGIVLFTLLHKS